MTPTLTWDVRSREEKALLNPAFLARMIERVAHGYEAEDEEGVPWPLLHIAVPAILHKPTRDALPHGVNTSMAAWCRGNPVIVVRLADRARTLQPLVREGLLYALAYEWVTQAEGRLQARPVGRRPRNVAWRDPTQDFRACANRATFFGRWLAMAGTPATAFALWGVRP
jgi:hypothetical protein